jgi:hypothetical protein
LPPPLTHNVWTGYPDIFTVFELIGGKLDSYLTKYPLKIFVEKTESGYLIIDFLTGLVGTVGNIALIAMLIIFLLLDTFNAPAKLAEEIKAGNAYL